MFICEGHARPAHFDPLFIQIKEEPASAYARYIPEGVAAWEHQGHRVMDGQRAMQLTSDPFLGYTTIDNRDYLVRQLNDHKAALDLKTLSAANLHGYADLCGELLARGHARAGDSGVHPRLSWAPARGLTRPFSASRMLYADKTEPDWEALCAWLKRNPKLLPAELLSRIRRRRVSPLICNNLFCGSATASARSRHPLVASVVRAGDAAERAGA